MDNEEYIQMSYEEWVIYVKNHGPATNGLILVVKIAAQ